MNSFLGFLLAGFAIPNLWSVVAAPFGNFAGLVAGALLIFPVWYLLHYRSLVAVWDDEITIDMGLAISLSIFVRDSCQFGLLELPKSVLTLFILALGSVLGGYAAFKVETYLLKGRG